MKRLLGVASMSGVILGLLMTAASASAAGGQATWKRVAQQAEFPVYRPRQTLGLRFDGVRLAPDTGCLGATWGNPSARSGPHLLIDEPGDTARCGQPGVANPVAKVHINGVSVPVLAQCSSWPNCTLRDGETSGDLLLFVPEHAGTHYSIQLQAAHISLRRFLKVARSFTRVKVRRQIYFWGDVASTVKAPGQRVAHEVSRPSRIFLFADGSWALVKLRWKGWGSKVAHGRGISSASNGIPNQAQGNRTQTPAQITLSRPGRFFGHEVYRCYRLIVPPPATALHGCLSDHNGYWVL